METAFGATERMEAGLQLELTRVSFDRAAVAVYWLDSTGQLAYANDAFCRALGYTRDQLSGLSLFDFTADVSKEDYQRAWSQLETQGFVTFESTHRGTNGEERTSKVSVFSLDSGEGRVACCIGHDISQRKREEARFDRFFELPLVASGINSPEGRWVKVNDRLCEMFGYPREELLGMTWANLTHPDDFGENIDPFEEEAHKRDVYSQDIRFVRKDGESLYCNVSVQCVRKDDGKPDHFISLFADITDRVNAEDALRESEERLRQAAELAKLGYWIWNTKTGKCEYCSDQHAAMVGMTPEEYIEHDPNDPETETLVHPEDRAFYKSITEELKAGKRVDYEIRLVSTDGSIRYLREISAPLAYDSQGNVVREIGTSFDITDFRENEMSLRQAQKMEAVGRVTGGVAHDFNNVLAIVMGNLELALEQIGPGTSQQLIKSALRASEQGAKLTHRLLAFARQQTLAPKSVDVQELLGGMSDLLKRVLGEDIDFELVTHAGQWKCVIDPHQLENVVLNLAINARDAMPEGGKLTVEVSNARLDDEYAAAAGDLEPGQYVCVAVTDTGTGMTEEVIEKAFDPFFTTKGVGEGTGLGLSMAHGFAKQSGGHIKIYSELGEGTTIKVYMPRSDKPAERIEAARADRTPQQGQGEKVLVVEDDPDLRSVIVDQLTNLGYETIEAQDGPTAMTELGSSQTIDLLLTDLVMPGGMNGRELSDKAAELRQGLPVVFMSGYTRDAVIHHGRLNGGAVLLQKPFRKANLAQAIRTAMKG